MHWRKTSRAEDDLYVNKVHDRISYGPQGFWRVNSIQFAQDLSLPNWQNERHGPKWLVPGQQDQRCLWERVPGKGGISAEVPSHGFTWEVRGKLSSCQGQVPLQGHWSRGSGSVARAAELFEVHHGFYSVNGIESSWAPVRKEAICNEEAS